MPELPTSEALHSRADPVFGRNMRSAFGLPRAPQLELRDLRFGPMAVTEMRYDAENYGRSAPIPLQDTLLVSLQLRANPHYQIWEDERRLESVPVRAGMLNVCDLRRNVMAESAHPFHCVNFAFPLQALDDWYDDVGRGFELDAGRRTGLVDPVVEALGSTLLPVLERPDSAPRMFVEHVLLALRAHLAHRFGTARLPGERRGGLSSWQMRRAQAYIEAHLGDDISLVDVAAQCSLSAAHFARAFRRSTGMPPHRFLMERRVERARELLVHTDLPLTDIAVRCGFADQSHLTKVFRRVLGVTPGSIRVTGR